jgi:2-octaprenyl-6-methoxyphenol hydroxylase
MPPRSEPTRTETYDIAVVGGGPAGLSAALLARTLGRSVLLIAAPRPADERTTALLAGSQGLFERTGIWPAIEAEAAPLRRIRIADATSRLIRAPEIVFDAAEIGLDAFGYNIPNGMLTGILDRACTSRGVVRAENAATSIAPGPEFVEVTTAAGQSFSARVLIGADGRNSLARGAAGIGVSEWRYEQSALVVNLRHTLPHRDTSTEFHTETGPFTLVPLQGNRSSLVCVETAEGAERLSAFSDDALANEIERRSSSILGQIEIDGPRQVFPLAGMRAHAFAARRIALVGEAAHVIPPLGAQGLNLGLRDVVELADALSAGDPGAPAHIESYNRRRRADVLARTAIVDGLNRSLLTDSLLVQCTRGLAIAALAGVPPLRRAVMRQGIAAFGLSGNRRPADRRTGESKPQGKRSGGRIRLPIR